MKLILLRFLTKRGELAYKKVCEAGEKESFTNKQITKRAFKDVVVGTEPLVVRIDIKIVWLAVQIELDKQIIKSLESAGAKQNTDYTIEVN